MLRQEVARLSKLETEEVFREHTGGVKSIFRVHEEDGATRSAPFRALVRTPRVLRPVQQMLGGDSYVYHTKINAKPAIEGYDLDVAPGPGAWSKDRSFGAQHWRQSSVHARQRHGRVQRRRCTSSPAATGKERKNRSTTPRPVTSLWVIHKRKKRMIE